MKKLIPLLLLCWLAACKSSKKATSDIDPSIKKEEKIDKSEEEVAEPIAVQFFKAKELAEVLAEADKANKWIYLDIGAKWCVPCQLMKKEVYTNPETVKIINENFIPYAVEIDKNEGPDLKLIFDIKSVPTLLFVDSKGRVKLRRESGLSHSSLIAYAKEAIILKAAN